MLADVGTRPPSRKLTCGALGTYDRDRVLAVADALGIGPAVAHEDASAMLVTDRDPVRWDHGSKRGFAWSERVETLDGSGFATWEDAARAGSACGLVAEGGRAFVHSSVTGIAPVYWMESGGAVYFASSVDALASTSGSLTPDWEAWASIFTISYPLGDRTPFREIRLLPPFSTLEEAHGRARVTEARWPWSEVEPALDVKAGAAGVLDALRASVARLPEGPLACHLSGGLDSRLALALAAEDRREVSAMSVNPDNGHDGEESTAAMIAASLDVPHQLATGDAESFWTDLSRRTLQVDFQFPRTPWRLPMVPALQRLGAVSVDGFGFDALATPGDRVFSPEATDPAGGDGTVGVVWDVLAAPYGRRRAWRLRGELGETLLASTRRQFLAESERFRGHPSRAVLTFFRTRQVRGISMTPYVVLGSEVPISTPLVDDDVARAALSISYETKRGGRLYDELFAAINPELIRLPSTRRGTAPPPSPASRRSRTTGTADAYYASVTNGPLAPWVRRHALRRLTWHERGKPPKPDRGAIPVIAFHQWCERYATQLGEVDVADGFGVARLGLPG